MKTYLMDSRYLRKAWILFLSRWILPIAALDTHYVVRSIVAVHGLNGHRENTWTANNINWLRDFLPSDIPNARILTWGYDANTHGNSQINTQHLYDHGRELVSSLHLNRRLAKVRKLHLKKDLFTDKQSRYEHAPSSSSLTVWEG